MAAILSLLKVPLLSRQSGDDIRFQPYIATKEMNHSIYSIPFTIAPTADPTLFFFPILTGWIELDIVLACLTLENVSVRSPFSSLFWVEMSVGERAEIITGADQGNYTPSFSVPVPFSLSFRDPNVP